MGNMRYIELQSPEWLKLHYIDKRLSTHKIAKILNSNHTTICCALRRHNIKRRSLSDARKVIIPPLIGKNSPTYGIRRYGKDAAHWQGGITPLRKAIRNLPEYKEWRTSIYERDNYTCQDCGKRRKAGDRVILNVHHNKKSFSKLYAEFLQEYNQFSPFEDQHTLVRLAMKWKPFWSAEGETLCEGCHDLTKKGNKNGFRKVHR